MYDSNVCGIDLVKQCGWCTVRQRREYFSAIPVNRCVTGTAPVYLSEKFDSSHGADTLLKIFRGSDFQSHVFGNILGKYFQTVVLFS